LRPPNEREEHISRNRQDSISVPEDTLDAKRKRFLSCTEPVCLYVDSDQLNDLRGGSGTYTSLLTAPFSTAADSTKPAETLKKIIWYSTFPEQQRSNLELR
jgi:hypothetical protein